MAVKVLGKADLHISETLKTNVKFVKIEVDEPEVVYVNHHILLADCSMSMYHNLEMLKTKIHETCDALLNIPNSYISILTYSSHNQTERILSAVKCDEMTYKMNNLHKVIEDEIYIKSVTVISEPLNQAIDICQSLAGVCDKHHIALFTDGCLVPWEWNSKTEERKCLDVAKYCNEHGIFLNAIGFGQYYDRRFLKELVAKAGNGAVLHIDYVEDYFKIILNAINKVTSDELTEVNILAVNNNYLLGTVLNLSTSQMSKKMIVKSINPNNNTFAIIDADYIIVNEDDEIHFNNNQILDLDNIIIEDFYYSLARYYLQEDDLDNYEFILSLLGDVGLLEETMNSYSFIEKGNARNKITQCIENPAKRFLNGKVPNINSLDEKSCILEILTDIINDENSTLLWDMETPYHRITQKSISKEDTISFVRNDNRFLPVHKVSIGSEKLNIGINVRIDGTVIDSESTYSKPACIYRDYNIVNGGNINVPYISAMLSYDLFAKFIAEGIIPLSQYDADSIINIELLGIKSVNKRILKSKSLTEITDMMVNIADLKCKQWAVNQLKKEALGDKTQLQFSNLSEEDKFINSILRLDAYGLYTPLAVEKDTSSPFEIYPAIFMTWNIARFPEKKYKENYLNNMKDIIIKAGYQFGKNDEDIIDLLNIVSRATKKAIQSDEFIVNSIRIASAMMNKSPFIWDEINEKDKKTTDKILDRNMVIGGKVTIKKKLVENIFDGNKLIEEKKWVQLVKCN